MKQSKSSSPLTLGACLAFSACSAQSADDPMETGGLISALVVSPVDGCIQVDAISDVRSRTEHFQVSAEVEQELIMGQLPLTAQTLSAALYPTPDCSGDPLYYTEPEQVNLSPLMPTGTVHLVFLGAGQVNIETSFEGTDASGPTCEGGENVMLDANESSNGWAGGTSKADLGDGEVSYDTWSRGLAFPGVQFPIC